MKFYTRKWYEFVYKNYYFNVENNLLKIASVSTEETKNIKYNDKTLKESFEKYYESKKKYVQSQEYLKSQFTLYETIELLSYEKEFKNYKTRIELFVKELQNLLNIKDNDIEYLYLLALNKFLKKTHQILIDNIKVLQKNNIKNNVNTFLTSYEDYINTKKNTKQYKEFQKIKNKCFEDYKILDYQENNNDIIIKFGKLIKKENIEKIIHIHKIKLTNAKVICATKDDSYIKDGKLINKRKKIHNYQKEIIDYGLINILENYIFEDYSYLLTLFLDSDIICEIQAENAIIEIENIETNKLKNTSFYNSKIIDIKREKDNIIITINNNYIINIKDPKIISDSYPYYQLEDIKNQKIIYLSYNEFDNKENYIYIETENNFSLINYEMYIFSNNIKISTDK